MSSDYIDWKDITPRMKVILVGPKGAQHWEAAGKIVLFSGREQRKAQAALNRRVAVDKKRFG